MPINKYLKILVIHLRFRFHLLCVSQLNPNPAPTPNPRSVRLDFNSPNNIVSAMNCSNYNHIGTDD